MGLWSVKRGLSTSISRRSQVMSIASQPACWRLLTPGLQPLAYCSCSFTSDTSRISINERGSIRAWRSPFPRRSFKKTLKHVSDNYLSIQVIKIYLPQEPRVNFLYLENLEHLRTRLSTISQAGISERHRSSTGIITSNDADHACYQNSLGQPFSKKDLWDQEHPVRDLLIGRPGTHGGDRGAGRICRMVKPYDHWPHRRYSVRKVVQSSHRDPARVDGHDLPFF